MKHGERGFTLIELLVATSLTAMIALVGTIFTFQALRTSAQTDTRLTSISNAQNAGYWLSRDAYMSDDVITANLTPPAILILKWTEWGYSTANTYYSATYSVDNITNHIGQLHRRLQSSGGLDQMTLVADEVYYNTADTTNSTGVSYTSPIINLKVSTRFGNISDIRDYQICHRPNF